MGGKQLEGASQCGLSSTAPALVGRTLHARVRDEAQSSSEGTLFCVCAQSPRNTQALALALHSRTGHFLESEGGGGPDFPRIPLLTL
jgi:hypothetical protein